MSAIAGGAVSSFLMIAVAVTAFAGCRRLTRVSTRWFLAGAAVWLLAVVLKFVCAILFNQAVLAEIRRLSSAPACQFAGAVFLGVESSLFEMGITLLAVMIWHRWGRPMARAIAIGIGAGAFEALLVGGAALASVTWAASGAAAAAEMRQALSTFQHSTPLFWLVGPVERIIAILCHGASRALILSGYARRTRWRIVGGFALFALLDSVAGWIQLSGKMGTVSMWKLESAIIPVGILSAVVLVWLGMRDDRPYRNMPRNVEVPP
ncbi:MAG: YhfC family intramembrane metalloprotease [Verrucomicrobia bacterium]|nr:MAG: YhfC family intramembrane metalloprotease [Verrucomicrobiota bacterium]